MLRFLISLLLILSSGAVCADERSNQASAWSFPASISVVSDYIFRVQTQTWGKPALLFGIEADYQSSFLPKFFDGGIFLFPRGWLFFFLGRANKRLNRVFS